jgi:hypothetical protein
VIERGRVARDARRGFAQQLVVVRGPSRESHGRNGARVDETDPGAVVERGRRRPRYDSRERSLRRVPVGCESQDEMGVVVVPFEDGVAKLVIGARVDDESPVELGLVGLLGL